MLLQPSQVTFTRIRYHEALQRWRWQKKVGRWWFLSSPCHKPRELHILRASTGQLQRGSFGGGILPGVKTSLGAAG